MARPPHRQLNRFTRGVPHLPVWKIALLALMGVLQWTGISHAGNVVIVLSGDAQPYMHAEEGFKKKFTGQTSSIRTILLSDVADKGIEATIGKSAAAVVAIGTPAADYLHTEFTQPVPLVYCMVTNPTSVGLMDGRPAFGVTIDVPIAIQIDLIAKAAPKARTLGMLYNSTAPEAKIMLKRVADALPRGWKLVAVAVDGYGSVADAIDALTSRHIDIVWTNIESGIYETATVRTLLLAGIRQKLPVYGFSPAFVRAGAIIGMGVDPTSQGEQAAGLAVRLLHDPADNTIPRMEAPEKFQIAVNLIVADKLGIQLPADLIQGATYVFKDDK